MTQLPVNQRRRIRILQLGMLLVVPLLFTMNPVFSGDGSDTIEKIGVALVLVCVVGRMWSILYIGSKKNRELVTMGPYSVTRNPLYFFSVIGVMGLGLFTGSLVMTFALGLASYLAFVATAKREAKHLEALFGDRYRHYERATPMFWPKLCLYAEGDEILFSPAALRRTFLDGLIFFAAFPAIEVMENLKDAGYLPMLFRIL